MLIGLTGYSGAGKTTAAQAIAEAAKEFFPTVAVCSIARMAKETLGVLHAEKTPELRARLAAWIENTYQLHGAGHFVNLELAKRRFVINDQDTLIIFDDVRRVGEAREIIDNGGEIWRVERLGCVFLDDADREVLDVCDLAERILANGGDGLDAFCADAKFLLRAVMKENHG